MEDEHKAALLARNDPAEYRDLMRRLNHAPTGTMTLSDIDWLTGLFRRDWWRIPKNRRDNLAPSHLGLYDGKTVVERLRAIAEKSGV